MAKDGTQATKKAPSFIIDREVFKRLWMEIALGRVEGRGTYMEDFVEEVITRHGSDVIRYKNGNTADNSKAQFSAKKARTKMNEYKKDFEAAGMDVEPLRDKYTKTQVDTQTSTQALVDEMREWSEYKAQLSGSAPIKPLGYK